MTRRVLFLCTGNSARSVLAESTLKKWGEGRYESFSAGSQPAGRVNPFAIAQLQREGFPVDGLRSKSWDEFAEADAAPMDLIVTVCDSAAAEACPVVFGDFVRVHWGLFDPAGVEGSDDRRPKPSIARIRSSSAPEGFPRHPRQRMGRPDALKAQLEPIAQIN